MSVSESADRSEYRYRTDKALGRCLGKRNSAKSLFQSSNCDKLTSDYYVKSTLRKFKNTCACTFYSMYGKVRVQVKPGHWLAGRSYVTGVANAVMSPLP